MINDKDKQEISPFRAGTRKFSLINEGNDKYKSKYLVTNDQLIMAALNVYIED